MMQERIPLIPFLVVTALLAVVLAATSTQAGPVGDPTIVLHAAPHAAKGDPCTSENNPVTAGITCVYVTTQWPLGQSADIYLVVGLGSPERGVGSMSCGILYNNGETGAAAMSDQRYVDVYGWTSCASGPVSYYPAPPSPDTWPASGSGIRLAWDTLTDCQMDVVGYAGVHAVAGAFYVWAYTDDVMRVIQNNVAPGGPEVTVGDCSGNIADLTNQFYMGGVNFGAATGGGTPCYYLPEKPLTWSQLKTKYKRP